ncbi:hypothetical protein KIPB_007930, partial [Kipferlia bialata]|eukprot:g7930.t1
MLYAPHPPASFAGSMTSLPNTSLHSLASAEGPGSRPRPGAMSTPHSHNLAPAPITATEDEDDEANEVGMYPFQDECRQPSTPAHDGKDSDFDDSSDDFDFESEDEAEQGDEADALPEGASPVQDDSDSDIEYEEEANDSYTWLMKGLNRMYTRATDEETLSFPPTVDTRVTQFIELCLCPDVSMRPSLEDLLAHPLFDGMEGTDGDSPLHSSFSDVSNVGGGSISGSRGSLSDMTANEIGKGLLKFEQRAAYKVDLDLSLSPEQEVLLMYHSAINVFNIINDLIAQASINLSVFPEFRDTTNLIGSIVGALMAPDVDPSFSPPSHGAVVELLLKWNTLLGYMLEAVLQEDQDRHLGMSMDDLPSDDTDELNAGAFKAIYRVTDDDASASDEGIDGDLLVVSSTDSIGSLTSALAASRMYLRYLKVSVMPVLKVRLLELQNRVAKGGDVVPPMDSWIRYSVVQLIDNFSRVLAAINLSPDSSRDMRIEAIINGSKTVRASRCQRVPFTAEQMR